MKSQYIEVTQCLKLVRRIRSLCFLSLDTSQLITDFDKWRSHADTVHILQHLYIVFTPLKVTDQYSDSFRDLFDICTCRALFASQYWIHNRKLISLWKGALWHEQINKVFNWPWWVMCKRYTAQLEYFLNGTCAQYRAFTVMKRWPARE